LVEPRLLRERGVGQCDLVRFFPGVVEIAEVKGESGLVSPRQRQRLREAGIFLGLLLRARVALQVCQERRSHLTFKS
jgi:hypothetical protein